MSIRNRASKLLGTILAMNDGQCYWCGIKLVHLAALPGENVVAVDGDWILYAIDGILYRAQIASADHILPVAMGGLSNPKNLVPACRRCNAFRNKHNGWLSGVERCQGDDCSNQIRPQKTHCKRCWRKLIGFERPEPIAEFRFQDRRYQLVERGVIAK